MTYEGLGATVGCVCSLRAEQRISIGMGGVEFCNVAAALETHISALIHQGNQDAIK